MAHDVDQAWEVDGPIVINNLAFYQGTVYPYSLPVLNAPLDSIYVQSDGTLWKKIGAGDAAADWLVVLSPTPPIVTVTDTNYLVAAGVSYIRYKLQTQDWTLQLPSATTQRILHIKVVENLNDEYNLNMITTDASLIEGHADAQIQCEGTAVSLWANGVDWEVVAR